MQTLGNYLKLTTFGESHGKAYGGILSNFPAGITLDLEKVQQALNRRRPGQSAIVTQRNESDTVELLSGIFEGKTTGMPIGFVIRNENQRSKDYTHLENALRPSHSDYTLEEKFGHRDYRGGGRSSARETSNWVVAGEICRQLLPSVSITAYVSGVGTITLDKEWQQLDFSLREENPVRCPDPEKAQEMEELIRKVRKEGDTVGGVVSCVVENVPKSLGEPVFQKLHAQLGHAMLSINAVKGFSYGSGFLSAQMRGSEHNDIFNEDFTTRTNHSGGIQGGISNGMPITFQVAFKPVATLLRPQQSYTISGTPTTLEGKGRHDPCVVPRAVPVVEALAAFVLADMYLINQGRKIEL